MPDDPTRHVVLLYVHPLLGEGIAAYVTHETGVPVLTVSALDPAAVSSALAGGPSVVIFERAAGVDVDRVVHAAPGALLIDVSDAVSAGPRRRGPDEPPMAASIARAVADACVPHPHAS
ncbi:MAG TPA: hypothetical protein VLS51_03380 [Propionibacteriaceae bacterium]|nr:hypothetical protein [Propionibacteriaceae bacterium]